MLHSVTATGYPVNLAFYTVPFSLLWTMDDKVAEGDERDVRKNSPQLGRRLRGKVTRRKEI